MGAQTILTEVQPTLLVEDFNFLRDKLSECKYDGYGEYHYHNSHYFFFAEHGEVLGVCTLKIIENSEAIYDLSFEVVRRGLNYKDKRVWQVLSLQALNYAKQNSLEPMCITVVNREKSKYIKNFFKQFGIKFVSNEARVDSIADLNFEA